MRFPSVVVVTGASAGVGRATVRRFAERGADVGLLARYLGRSGYRSQQTDEPRDPDRPANLWAPVPGDDGAHGRFDDRAHPHSLQLWATTHRGTLAGLAGAGLAGRAALAVARR
jgi:NAD(P)-dependent dehydrogenase (short-subunit alcohol dehydrogenase family)